jgi:NADPH:quinone reductase-like Zn-dependent oxidoreductase
MLVAVPDSVSFEEAAALPCAGWTAYLALHHRMKIESGKTIVVTAASGGVGGFAVQLAKKAGLKVIATARKANEEYVRSLGADYVIDYTVDKVHYHSQCHPFVIPTGSINKDFSTRTLLQRS